MTALYAMLLLAMLLASIACLAAAIVILDSRVTGTGAPTAGVETTGPRRATYVSAARR